MVEARGRRTRAVAAVAVVVVATVAVPTAGGNARSRRLAGVVAATSTAKQRIGGGVGGRLGAERRNRWQRRSA